MKNLKRKFLCLLAFLVCICTFLGILPVGVYADNSDPSWLPGGYKIYKSETLEDGKIKYYLIPKSYGFHEYDEEGRSFSFSPQMTYSLYGVEGDGLIEDGSDAMKVIADYYDIGIDELTESLIYDYMMSKWDTSSSLSNSFAYSGIPDEDSYCVTTFDGIDMSNWFSYAEYWCYDLVGANDWYIALSNMFGWHNVYNSDFFNNYKNDYVTFSLYNDDDGDLFSAGTSHTAVSQVVQDRWNNGNIAVSGYNVVKFQSLATSILSSGTLIFDNAKVSTGLKTKLSDLFTSLADGAWLDILEYNDYKKIHTGESDPINLNWLDSPVKDIKIEGNNLIVTIPDNYSYKIGYYVDYLVYDSGRSNGQKYHLYRHYFYPESIGKTLLINGNSIETKLPFTNCSLDGSTDNTLLKGVGFFGYGLNTQKTSKTVAEFAPSKTAGMGDISFITSYDYYCFDYPFKDNDSSSYGYDFNINISDYECLVYIVDGDTVTEQSTETIEYTHTFSDTIVSDGGTYIVNNITYNIDGNYIEEQINNLNDYISEDDKKVIFSESEIVKCCDDCTCTLEKHCDNCTEINGVLTCICATNGITCDCYKESSSSSGSTNNTTDDNYWKQWKEWIVSCKEFIGSVPDLLAYVYSWFPKPLIKFIELSIMTGFGIAVIKVCLRRE